MESRSERLKLFVKICYEKNSMKLAKVLEHISGNKLSRQNMSHYMNNEKPSTQVVSLLYQAGLNANYYLFGIGDMFAENDPGRRLKSKYGESNFDELAMASSADSGISKYGIISAIKEWIIFNFGSLENFALTQDCNVEFLNQYLTGKKAIDDEFHQFLRKAGFNFSALFYEGHSLYLDTPEGNALRAKHDSSMGISSVREELKNIKIDITSDKNKAFVKEAVAEAISEMQPAAATVSMNQPKAVYNPQM